MSKKKEQMYALVEQWQKSQATKTDFCKAHQINIHTFTYWLQKYKKQKTVEGLSKGGEKFISLQLAKEEVLSAVRFELCYQNGVRLRVEGNCSISDLKSLLQIKL